MSISFNPHAPAFSARRLPYHAAPARFGNEPETDLDISGILQEMVGQQLEALAKAHNHKGVANLEHAIMSVVDRDEADGKPVAKLIRCIQLGLKETCEYTPSSFSKTGFMQWLIEKEARYNTELEELMAPDEWARHRMQNVFMA